MKYSQDPEQAIIRAINDTRDNDTIATITGAAVGTQHGKSSLPEQWINRLLARTNASNDGHVFELMQQAKDRFWELQ
jgi:ADP-ribosylglycohydrolase